jgi:hypothetical protein
MLRRLSNLNTVKLHSPKDSDDQQRRSCWPFVTRKDLERSERHIMEAIDIFAAAVNAAFDALGESVDGVAADVTMLKQQIAELQNTGPTWTPADQQKLDDIQARAETVAAKVALLDAATENPPVTPPTP